MSKNPAAIHLLEQNPEKINWHYLSQNPAAIHLLEKHPEKIDWSWFSSNPAMFTYDYVTMKQTKAILHNDLIQSLFHPKNIHKFDNWGFDTGFQEEDL